MDITARLGDMRSTLTLYNAIDADLSTVLQTLSDIATESTGAWTGEASKVFNENAQTIIEQVKTLRINLMNCCAALTTAICTYSALESDSVTAIAGTATEFVSV